MTTAPSEGGVFKNGFHLLERGNIAFELVATLMPASISRFLFHDNRSFVELMVLTAPLTIGIVFIVFLIANAKFETYVGYSISASAILIGLAILSSLIGVGHAVNWMAIFEDVGKNGFVGLMILPLALLQGYFQLYGTGPFLVSVAIGATWGISSVYRARRRAVGAPNSPAA